jgi:hypothetical protein
MMRVIFVATGDLAICKHKTHAGRIIIIPGGKGRGGDGGGREGGGDGGGDGGLGGGEPCVWGILHAQSSSCASQRAFGQDVACGQLYVSHTTCTPQGRLCGLLTRSLFRLACQNAKSGSHVVTRVVGETLATTCR